MVTNASKRQLRLFSTNSNAPGFTLDLTSQDHDIRWLRFSPESDFLFMHSSGNRLQKTQWEDLRTGHPTYYHYHQQHVTAVAMCERTDSLWMAQHHHIRQRCISELEVQQVLSYHPPSRIKAMAVSPNGEQLIIGCKDDTVRILDVATGLEYRCYKWGIKAIEQILIAPDGMRAAARGKGRIVIWDLED